MPTNLYGPFDRYDPRDGHVVAALVMKIHAAKVAGSPTVELWGTGTPTREFLFSEDLADACVFVMKNYSGGLPLNVSTGVEISIVDLANTIATVIVLARTLRLRYLEARRHAAQSHGRKPTQESWLVRNHRFPNRMMAPTSGTPPTWPIQRPEKGEAHPQSFTPRDPVHRKARLTADLSPRLRTLRSRYSFTLITSAL